MLPKILFLCLILCTSCAMPPEQEAQWDAFSQGLHQAAQELEQTANQNSGTLCSLQSVGSYSHIYCFK